MAKQMARKSGAAGSVDQLIADPENARVRTERSRAVLEKSLGDFGAARSVVVDADGIVRAGNGTVDAAKAAGITKVIEVETDGTQLVVVKRTDLRGLRAKAYAIADNRSGELATWDLKQLDLQLGELTSGGIDVGDLGFLDTDISELLGSVGGTDSESSDEPAAEPEVPPAEVAQAKWNVAAGELFEITGETKHRLLCGDSRNASDVDMLIAGVLVNLTFTSPPYASQRKYDESSGFEPIPPDDYVEWWEPLQANVSRVLAEDGSLFVNIKPHADGLDTDLYVHDLVCAHVRRWGWHFATEFCWERSGMPKSVTRRFKNQFEPVYQFAKSGWKMRPDAVRHASSEVPTNQKASKARLTGASGSSAAMQGNNNCPGEFIGEGMAFPGNRLPIFSHTHDALGHSAAFPVGLPSFFVKAYSDAGDTVFEPFCGSGSTLVACEQLGRRGFGMEISPAYCAIILERMASNGCEIKRVDGPAASVKKKATRKKASTTGSAKAKRKTKRAKG